MSARRLNAMQNAANYGRRKNNESKRSNQQESFIVPPYNGVVRKGKGFLHRIIYDPHATDEQLFAKIQMSCRNVVSLVDDFNKWDEYKIEHVVVVGDNSTKDKPNGVVSIAMVQDNMDGVTTYTDETVDLMSSVPDHQHKKFGENFTLELPKKFTDDRFDGWRSTNKKIDTEFCEIGTFCVAGTVDPIGISTLSIFVNYKISFRNSVNGGVYKLFQEAHPNHAEDRDEPAVVDNSTGNRNLSTSEVVRSGNEFLNTYYSNAGPGFGPNFLRIPLSCRDVDSLKEDFAKWEEYRLEHLDIQIYGAHNGVARADRGAFAWGVVVDNFTTATSHSLELIEFMKGMRYHGEHKYGDNFCVNLSKTYLIDNINRGWRGTHVDLDTSAKELGHLILAEISKPKEMTTFEVYVSYTVHFRNGAPKNNSVLYELWPDHIKNPYLPLVPPPRFQEETVDTETFLKEGTGYFGKLVFYPDHPNRPIFAKLPISCRDVASVAGHFREWSEYRVEALQLDIYSSSRGGPNGLFRYGIIVNAHNLNSPDINAIRNMIPSCNFAGVNRYGEDGCLSIPFSFLSDDAHDGWRSTSNRGSIESRELAYLFVIGDVKPIGISTINLRVKYRIRFRNARVANVQPALRQADHAHFQPVLNPEVADFTSQVSEDYIVPLQEVSVELAADQVIAAAINDDDIESSDEDSQSYVTVGEDSGRSSDSITLSPLDEPLSQEGYSSVPGLEGSSDEDEDTMDDVSDLEDEIAEVVEDIQVPPPAPPANRSNIVTVDAHVHHNESHVFGPRLVARNGDNGLLPLSLACQAKISVHDILKLYPSLPMVPKVLRIEASCFRLYLTDGNHTTFAFSHIMWNPYAKRAFFMPITRDPNNILRMFLGSFHTGSEIWLYQTVTRPNTVFDIVADNLAQYNNMLNSDRGAVLKSMIDQYGNIINMSVMPGEEGRDEWFSTFRRWKHYIEAPVTGQRIPKITRVQLLYLSTAMKLSFLKEYMKQGQITPVWDTADLPTDALNIDDYIWPDQLSAPASLAGLYFRTSETFIAGRFDVFQNSIYRIDAVFDGVVLCSKHADGEPALPRYTARNTMLNIDN